MNDKPPAGHKTDAHAPDRTTERGDAAAPDTPTAVEENAGLSTVLSGEPGEGAQDNASEE